MSTRLFYRAETRCEALAELSRVSLKRDVDAGDARVLTASSTGTVVAVLQEGVAYLVEFTKPFEALIEVDIGDLEPLSGESRDDLLAGRMAHRAS